MQKRFLKVLSKKALCGYTALAISGLVPAGVALAGELVITEAELVLPSTNVSVVQGATQNFTLKVESDGNLNSATVTLPTIFTIASDGSITGSNPQTVTLTGFKGSTTVDAVVSAADNLQPGTYSFTFNGNNVSFSNTGGQQGAKLENKKEDTIYFTVTKKPTPADTTGPVVTASANRAPDYNGWYNHNVTVNFSAVDEEGGSGVDLSSVTAPVTVSTDGIHTVTGTAKDKAGNSGNEASITIKLDKTAPTITGSAEGMANENGWYNHDVTVNFTADDETSGIESYTETVTLKDEGANQSAEGNAKDNAGNTSSTSVSGINIDKTKPNIDFESGGTYTLNQVVPWLASDDGSGIETTSGSISTSKVGPQTVTLTATDKAGNTQTKTISYTVVYNFGGVLQPVTNKSTFKSGSTIPVKFQLKDSFGNYISTANATISLIKTSNSTSGDIPVDISSGTANTGNQFRYDYTSNQYIFNLSTKGLSGTYVVSIDLGDKTQNAVTIVLK